MQGTDECQTPDRQLLNGIPKAANVFDDCPTNVAIHNRGLPILQKTKIVVTNAYVAFGCPSEYQLLRLFGPSKNEDSAVL